jgi:hypothetical protein
MKIFFRACLLLACLALLGGPAAAQSRHKITFKKGANSAKVKGTIRGYEYRDYLIGANAGQTISLKLASMNTYTMFSIFQPDGQNLAGAAQVVNFGGRLPATGDFVIRVAMMRAEAQRKRSASDYSITVSIN